MLCRLVLKKDDLDDAFKDKRFPESAKVEMLFERDQEKGAFIAMHNVHVHVSVLCTNVHAYVYCTCTCQTQGTCISYFVCKLRMICMLNACRIMYMRVDC